MLERLAAWLGSIGADPRDDDEARQSRALLVLISLLILPISLLWGALYLALGSPVGVVPLIYALILGAAVLVFSRTRDAAFLLRVNLTDILLAPTISMAFLGGFLGSGGVGLWGILAPLGALVFSGLRSAVRWYVAYIVVFLASGIAGEILGSVSTLPTWFTTTMLALNITVGGTIFFILLAIFVKQRHEALDALRVEKAKSENLLLNILPRSIAERLKAQPQTIADHFDAASILFADVVDFTPQMAGRSPAELVGMLDQLFGHFDTLVADCGLEKIKTIGDCYMAAAGVPSARPDHARALALLALAMMDAVNSKGAVGNLGFELRIGINSGPVVAGVIGHKRLIYDLWGDSVNIASRMESHGTRGRIQISEATYELLKDEFDCEPRGPVAVKGKGDMETWYLVGLRARAAQPAAAAAA